MPATKVHSANCASHADTPLGPYPCDCGADPLSGLESFMATAGKHELDYGVDCNVCADIASREAREADRPAPDLTERRFVQARVHGHAYSPCIRCGRWTCPDCGTCAWCSPAGCFCAEFAEYDRMAAEEPAPEPEPTCCDRGECNDDLPFC